jgi:hypothetical protein
LLVYVKQCLAATLKRKDIVVIDNLSPHKALREAIEARRCASLSAAILAAVQQAQGVPARRRNAQFLT